MHFTIVGAGAIGGTVGAHLVRGGHEVLFVDRDRAHVDAMNTAGLTIEGRQTFAVRARAVAPEGLRGVVRGHVQEAVLLCVKAMDPAPAVEARGPLLAPDNFIVSLQNGLNERVIAGRIGAARTIGAFVNFGADYLGPGRVMYGGTGALYLGELNGPISARVRGLEEVFRSCLLPATQATSNIWGFLWGKLGYGAMLFATALVDASIADVLAHAPSRPMLANLAAEVVRVAQAEGVRCEGFDGYEPAAFAFHHPRDWEGIGRSLDQLVAFNRASLKQKSGVWRDLAVRKRKTEVDQQVGAVVETASSHRLPAPLNARLLALIHDIEDGRRAMPWQNLEELAAVNSPGFYERSMYTNPVDGKNINRTFPGDPAGSAAQRVTHFLTTELITGADAYVDLHGGDLIEALVPFAIYQQTGRADVDGRAQELADAYGLEYVLAAPADALRGTSYSAAARLGVPSIIAEVGQQGIYDQDSVERHLAGLRNVLVHLRMLEGRPSPVTRPQRLSRFAWMYADATATYHPVVAAGQVVTEGQSIGALRDIFGETVQELRAPAGGLVLFLVTALAVKKGDPLIGIGVP